MHVTQLRRDYQNFWKFMWLVLTYDLVLFICHYCYLIWYEQRIKDSKFLCFCEMVFWYGWYCKNVTTYVVCSLTNIYRVRVFTIWRLLPNTYFNYTTCWPSWSEYALFYLLFMRCSFKSGISIQCFLRLVLNFIRIGICTGTHWCLYSTFTSRYMFLLTFCEC